MTSSIIAGIELEISKGDFEHIIAFDEAGRGSLFGPVTVAAVAGKTKDIRQIFSDPNLDKVNDSKKLSQKLRTSLFNTISEILPYRVFHSAVSYIDKYNINQAIKLAIYRISQSLLSTGNYDIHSTLLLIDGNYRFTFPTLSMPLPMPKIQTLIKGDSKSQLIAAASIMAKVCRDKLMINASQRFPQYHLNKNMGYGTKHHINTILEQGPCKFHRRKYISNLKPR